MKKYILPFLFCFPISLLAQEDLLSLLEDSTAKKPKEKVYATFKTTRVINLPSVENVAGGVDVYKRQILDNRRYQTCICVIFNCA